MRRYIRPLALTALSLISWLSVAPHATALPALSERARKTSGYRACEVTSVVAGSSSLIINTSGQSPLAPPAVRFYPGDNGESVMVADFVGVNFGQSSRVVYPAGGGVQKVRMAQIQNHPPIFRLVFSAPSMRVFKKVEFSSSSPGALVVKLPATADINGNLNALTKSSTIQKMETSAGGELSVPRVAPSRFLPSRASAPNVTAAAVPVPPAQTNVNMTTVNSKSGLPPMPSGGLVLDLQVDGQSVPAVAPPVVNRGRLFSVSKPKVELSKSSVDPNKPVLRGPIVVDVVAPAASESPGSAPASVLTAASAPAVAPPVSRKAVAACAPPSVAPPLAATTPSIGGKKPPKGEKSRPEIEVVEVVAVDEPPMLPGLSSVKKAVQISSASKNTPPVDGIVRGARGLTKAFAGSGGKTDSLPLPFPSSVALSSPEKTVDEEAGANLAESVPDIAVSGTCEVKILSAVPLRFAVSSSTGRLLKTKSFRLHDPERHVIDVENAADLASATMPEIPENAFVKTVRLGSPDGASGRIVLDLTDEETQVCERCDETGLLIIDVAKEVLAPFNPVARLPGGSVIVVDAGHGGSDPGAQRGDIQEKEITLAICEKLRKILRRQGAKVVMTRSDDTFVSLEERVRITNETAPSAFVSVHINSLESNNSITGIETYYLHPQSKSLAESVHTSLVSKLAVPDRNVRTARFYVVNHTPYPAILAEVGFISNKDERDKLISSDYQQKIAEALAQGVIVYVATHGANPGASIASATAAGMTSVKQAARSSRMADASGTRVVQPASRSKKGKRFTQILHAKKPSGREKSSKIVMSRRKAKKSSKRIAIAHRSLRSNRSR